MAASIRASTKAKGHKHSAKLVINLLEGERRKVLQRNRRREELARRDKAAPGRGLEKAVTNSNNNNSRAQDKPHKPHKEVLRKRKADKVDKVEKVVTNSSSSSNSNSSSSNSSSNNR